MKKFFLRFIQETEGQDLIEYALLAGIIAIGAVTIMGGVSSAINGQFTNISTTVGS
jgi:pilus assembly protein Flp/PilA